MRVLIVDDEVQRHEGLALHFIGADIDHAYTAKEARRFLLGSRYDVVCLDHDLAGIKAQVVEDTGQGVARAIVELEPGARPGYVWIHSWNYYGALRIASILAEVGVPHRREMYQVPA